MSKKISQENYYERLRNLANVNESTKSNKTNDISTLIDFKRADNGVAYGIVKENHNYYIKKGGLKESPDSYDFTYIGGEVNKKEYQYKSLAEADKNRSMILNSINESLKIKMDSTSKKMIMEDVAKDEIENSEEKLSDLDAATANAEEKSEEIPAETPELEPTEDNVDIDNLNVPDESSATEELPAETPEENPEAGDDKSEEIKEIQSDLGKLANKIRLNKEKLEDIDVKSIVNSFLSAFKGKFDNLEVEEREAMADKILKTVPDEDISSLDVSAEENIEEQCGECGGFAQFAVSEGYDKDSFMASSDEDKTHLISKYANAYNEGLNEGDFDNVSLFTNEAIVNSLVNEYGHEEFGNKLTECMKSLNEMTEEDKELKINELFGGLGSLGKGIGSTLKQAAQDIKQTYHTGEINPKIKEVERDALNLGNKIKALNDTLQKAGKQPINTQSLLMSISNQISRGGAANLNKYRVEENDVANTEVSPNMINEDDDELDKEVDNVDNTETEIDDVETNDISFAPQAQSLGAAIIKPEGSTTSTMDVNIDGQSKNINIKLNETLILVNNILSNLSEGKKIEKIDKNVVDKTKKVKKTEVIKENKPKVTAEPKANKTATTKPKLVSEEEKVKVSATPQANKTATTKPKMVSEENKPKVTAEPKANKTATTKPKLVSEEEKVKVTSEPKANKTATTKPKMVSESETKIRQYIRQRIEENEGIRKSTLNESKKSEKLKKLDAMIDEQYFQLKKKSNLDEGFFGVSYKKEFLNLDPNNEIEVNNLFDKVFHNILTNPKMGRIGIKSKKTPFNVKYEILKKYYENNGGTLRLAPDLESVRYASKDVENKSTRSMMQGGGTERTAGGV